jgi:hypothetical protein
MTIRAENYNDIRDLSLPAPIAFEARPATVSSFEKIREVGETPTLPPQL